MANTDVAWRELYDHGPGGSEHPEEQAQRQRLAREDAQRRALLPQREAQLVAARIAAREKEAAVEAAEASLAVATAANAARYRRVVQGRGVRDPHTRQPIHWLDDERCEPELSRRKLAEQALAAARAERTQAVEWRDWLVAEVCYIKGTIPVRA